MPEAACSGWNEGVGEHVRTRSHGQSCGPWNCRPQAICTERRKPVSSAGPAPSGANANLKVRSSRLTWCLADTLFASIRAVRIDGSVRGAL